MKHILIGMLLSAALGIGGMGMNRVHTLTIVAFGDSITQGSALPAGVKNWTELLSRGRGTQIINAGVAGNSSAQALARLDGDVLSHRPDYVIINFGMNDSVLDGPNYHSLEEFERNMTQIVERIRLAGATPVLVTPNPVIEGDSGAYYYSRHDQAVFAPHGGAQAVLSAYAQCVREIAVRTGTPLADVGREWENHDPFDLLISLKNYGVDDGVHPGEAGVRVYARVIGDCLAKLTDHTDSF